jgi:site-specific recombinase XerD
VSWEAAQDRVRGWEAAGQVGVIKTVIPDIDEAVDRFFDDIKARGLSDATIGKQTVLLRKQLLPWCRTRGFRALKQLGVDELTQFRTTWADSPISKYKKQERLKGFFHFCVAREWITKTRSLPSSLSRFRPRRRCHSRKANHGDS